MSNRLIDLFLTVINEKDAMEDTSQSFHANVEAAVKALTAYNAAVSIVRTHNGPYTERAMLEEAADARRATCVSACGTVMENFFFSDIVFNDETRAALLVLFNNVRPPVDD